MMTKNDIDPDGVRIVIQWEKLVPGASMFIPCINTRKAKRQLSQIAKRRDIKLSYVAGPEGSKWGLRVWRDA